MAGRATSGQDGDHGGGWAVWQLGRRIANPSTPTASDWDGRCQDSPGRNPPASSTVDWEMGLGALLSLARSHGLAGGHLGTSAP